jgi:hypothetical protein
MLWPKKQTCCSVQTPQQGKKWLNMAIAGVFIDYLAIKLIVI